jgi:hypothetical protein
MGQCGCCVRRGLFNFSRQQSISHLSGGYSNSPLSLPLSPPPMAVYNSRDKLAYFKDNKQTQENQVRTPPSLPGYPPCESPLTRMLLFHRMSLT